MLPLEEDLSPNLRSELNAISLLGDAELWEVAQATMAEEQQTLLETLADLKKHRRLTDDEQSTLTHLIGEGQKLMLRKAEAYRLLAHRGHKVFHYTEDDYQEDRASIRRFLMKEAAA